MVNEMQIEILNGAEILVLWSELVVIEKLKFLGISWYKFELDLNSSVFCGTNST